MFLDWLITFGGGNYLPPFLQMSEIRIFDFVLATGVEVLATLLALPASIRGALKRSNFKCLTLL